jgi:flagellum-specific peptidoglycan hydrolase FlgJ
MTTNTFVMHVFTQLKGFFQGKWFKVTVILILAFIVFKKDLSFKIHLNNPSPAKQPTVPAQPIKENKGTSTTERFSDNRKQPYSENHQNETERFDFTPTVMSRAPATRVQKLSTLDADKIQRYIDRFDQVAINERDKFGIPPSIIIANALLHSLAGTLEHSSAGNNNHFSLSCTADWQGPSGTYEGKCYRHYENAWMSFRDHSLYLTTGTNTPLKSLGTTNYKAWAEAIEDINYSDEPALARQLVQVIEQYQLYILDES